jgi:hypothetical protein
MSCGDQKTSLYGILVAACFKGVAASNQMGAHQETYGITTMVNCRSGMTLPLKSRDCGFFHSALMQHHSVAEKTEVWALARRCNASLERAIAENEHFKDMWVLNTLFAQVRLSKCPSDFTFESRRFLWLTILNERSKEHRFV